MNYYIKNATLVNEGQTFVASVFVSDGKIAKIVKSQVPEPVEGPSSPSFTILAILPSETKTLATKVWPSLTSVAFLI